MTLRRFITFQLYRKYPAPSSATGKKIGRWKCFVCGAPRFMRFQKFKVSPKISRPAHSRKFSPDFRVSSVPRYDWFAILLARKRFDRASDLKLNAQRSVRATTPVI